MKLMAIEITVGGSASEPRIDGVRFACISQAVADKIVAAYEAADAEFERVVDALCSAGKAELL